MSDNYWDDDVDWNHPSLLQYSQPEANNTNFSDNSSNHQIQNSYNDVYIKRISNGHYFVSVKLSLFINSF